jgi:hypothetical protein
MKKIILPFSLFALTLLSACGSNLKTAKQVQGLKSEAVLSSDWGATLEDGCKSRNGQFLATQKLCIYTSLTKALAGGASGTSEELTSLEIGPVNPGMAILAAGMATDESVTIAIDGLPISAVPSKGNRAITIGKGGKLEFQLKPGGYFEGVKVYVYTCVDESLRDVRCPY